MKKPIGLLIVKLNKRMEPYLFEDEDGNVMEVNGECHWNMV